MEKDRYNTIFDVLNILGHSSCKRKQFGTEMTVVFQGFKGDDNDKYYKKFLEPDLNFKPKGVSLVWGFGISWKETEEISQSDYDEFEPDGGFFEIPKGDWK